MSENLSLHDHLTGRSWDFWPMDPDEHIGVEYIAGISDGTGGWLPLTKEGVRAVRDWADYVLATLGETESS